YPGDPRAASKAFAPLLARGPEPEAFFDPEKIPYYGFLISLTGSPVRIWAASRKGGGDPYAWARDEKNGMLWEGDEGVLKIHSDADPKELAIRENDFVSKVLPDERDGTAWVYLSHQKGELQRVDRGGKTLKTLPLLKFQGTPVPMVADLPHGALWYV